MVDLSLEENQNVRQECTGELPGKEVRDGTMRAFFGTRFLAHKKGRVLKSGFQQVLSYQVPAFAPLAFNSHVALVLTRVLTAYYLLTTVVTNLQTTLHPPTLSLSALLALLSW